MIKNNKIEGTLMKDNRIVGTFINSKSFGFVVPDDKKIKTDIFIPKANFGKARNSHKVIVEITKQAKNGKKPEGRIVEVIGGVNEAGVDMLSLIKEYELPYKFPEEVVKEAKQIEQQIQEKEKKGRRDLRGEVVFTIDGEDAKDLDDSVKL